MNKKTKNALSQYLQRIAATMLLLLIMGVTAHAIPAKPGQTRQLRLADGTTVSARLVGDEHGHYWLAQDGKAYIATDDKEIYQHVDVQAIRQNALERRTKANTQWNKRLKARQQDGSAKVNKAITGQKKCLIILVNFNNVSFKSANNQPYYERIANEKNFSDGDFVGSMYDYFFDQSDGQFELTFDVAGPYTMPKDRSYYGKNDSQGNDQHPGEMVVEALKQANKDVNFADYDWDGDKEVEQIYVVYAGQGEADGGASTTIWPHAYSLTEAAYYGDGGGAQTLDGVKIDTYACGGELNGSGKIDGIGTMCHEFSHCLGYPDFYDTDYSGGQGMGYWDLMDSGCYNGDGYRPSGYTAYERWVAGWKEPIELTATRNVEEMKALNNGGESYIIYNNGNRNEYFMLENRQQTGWDAGLPASGLLIVHVDYNQTAWEYNQPNDTPSHQRMTWIPADNEYQYEMYNGTKYYTFQGQAKDLYPQGKVNAFSKNTTPAAKFYNKNIDKTYYLDSSVENITKNTNRTISFRFKAPSNVPAPTFTPAAGRYTEPQQVTIACKTADATIYYTTDGTEPTTESTVYTEAITISKATTVKAVAVVDDDMSDVATANYVIVSNDVSNSFVKVKSVDDLVAGNRYVIGCGSKAKAAGTLNSTYLTAVDVTVSTDTMTIGEKVAVFILEGDVNDGWTMRNEETGNFLYAVDVKKMGYTDSNAQTWTLGDGSNGVEMSFDYGDINLGTITYNSASPRFTTYTTNATASMIRANLYMMRDNSGTQSPEKHNVILSFSCDSVDAVIGEEFTAPTLTIDPVGTVVDVTYSSSNPEVATVDEASGEVTILAEGITTIKASFKGNETYNPAEASYTLTVSKKIVPINVTMTATKGGSIRLGDEVVSGETKQIVVETNDELTFEITAEEAYLLQSVTLNGEDVTNTVADGLLTVAEHPEDLEIVATFQKKSFTITATAGEGGSIALSSEQTEWGGDIIVTITPDEDYELASLTVNGNDVTPEVTDLTYTIRDVRDNVEVTATFHPTVAYITIGEDGIATYCSDLALDFSGVEGITAYIAVGFVSTANAVVMVPATYMPASNGMVVKGEPGTYKVPRAQTSDYYVNILKGNIQEVKVSPTSGNMTNYTLTGDVFSSVKKKHTIEANSAIVQLPSSIEAEDGQLAILFVEQGEGEQGDKFDVNGDGVVDVADIASIIAEMAARSRAVK